ncbi:MAG TPA: hypothetical protein VHV31_16665, partial [Nitrolancea sp.]|nr:hypothetical protein [Nitrolancea sp.]
MTRRTSPEIAIFGSVVSIRLPWLIAIAFALGLTAFQLAPNHSIDNHTILWYLNAFLLVCLSVGAVLFHESAHALVAGRFE